MKIKRGWNAGATVVQLTIPVHIRVTLKASKLKTKEALWDAMLFQVRKELRRGIKSSHFIGGIGYFVPKVTKLGPTVKRIKRVRA